MRGPELDASHQNGFDGFPQELEGRLDRGFQGVGVGVSVGENKGDGFALEGRVGEPGDVAGDVDVN